MTDLAAELEHAESLLSARTGARLRVIPDQIQSLQAEACKILEGPREEQVLTRAQCRFNGSALRGTVALGTVHQ
jgi:hypothetical protein